jgi:hypothetical protein
MKGLSLAVVAACAWSAGCTLLFDGSEFRADASISRPVIGITESPTTLDTIEVALLEPSVDRQGGAVAYEYAWTLDGAASSVTSAAVPWPQTAKGQTWEVTVTPVVGERRGPSATASTTVVNHPPIVASVGLSTYEPREDDVLAALPGGVYDPDGDAFTFTFEWFKGSDSVASGPSSTLDLAAQGFVAGDDVVVQAVATDGDASEPVSIGAAVVPAVTAWRQLLPNRTAFFEESSFAVHDVRNGRIVASVDGQLWEYYLGVANIAPRWVQLRPTGTPPPQHMFGTTAVYDPSQERVLIVGGATEGPTFNVSTVYTLDLTRGAEAWSSFEAGGQGPEALLLSSVAIDARRERLLAFGSFPFEEGFPTSDKLYALSLTSGAEAWSEVDVNGDAPGFLFAPIWVVDVDADVAYMAGGMRESGGVPLGSQEIRRLDLTEGEESFALLTEALPAASAGGGGAFDPIRRRAYFVHGVGADGETPQDAIFAFDVDVGVVSDITAADPMPGTALGQASWDPATGRVLVLGMLSKNEVRAFSIASLDHDGTWQALDMPWVTGPGPVAEPGYFLMDRAAMYTVGGRDIHGEPQSGVFRFDFGTNGFQAVNVEPDGTHGTPPAGWGYGPLAGEDSLDERYLVGGSDQSGPLEPVEVWRFERIGINDWRWRFALASDVAVRPPGRSGAITFTARPACEDPPSRLVSVFGGMADGAVTQELAHFHCGAGECWWEPGIAPAILGSLAYAGINSYVALGGIFGGVNAAFVGTSEAWLPECPFDLWTAFPLADPPPPRFGHTYLYAQHASDDQRLYVFGGKESWDGGTYYNDAWVLMADPPMNGEWVAITPADGADYPHPAPRYFHAAAWDSVRRRLIVFGGEVEADGGEEEGKPPPVRNDLWELRVVE